ncbi:MFS transporter, partial [Pseudomonas syringae pv. tagetis]
FGPFLGPTHGGCMDEYLSCHSNFLLNIPVAIHASYAVKHFIPDLPGGGRTRLDAVGFILIGAAMEQNTIALEGLGQLHLPHMRLE